mmetsp:Transcript_10240/g.29410  ORF Transcript_10240/g.29410 Transcript_10240/m.29410 type:complete len:114 (+) Transcript_10240:84-425(+)
MVNPVDKLRKQQQKKLLLKQKKERQERNRNKFKNQSKNEVQDEIEKLQRKPKSMVNAKDEQKMKSLERLLEEKKDDDDKNAASPCTIIRSSTRSGSRRQGSLKNTCRGREVEK